MVFEETCQVGGRCHATFFCALCVSSLQIRLFVYAGMHKEAIFSSAEKPDGRRELSARPHKFDDKAKQHGQFSIPGFRVGTAAARIERFDRVSRARFVTANVLLLFVS